MPLCPNCQTIFTLEQHEDPEATICPDCWADLEEIDEHALYGELDSECYDAVSGETR